VPLQAIRDLLQTADVYVSASTSDGTSSSLLEAMASGAFPVLTHIAANVPWVVPGKTGLLFEPADPSSLAVALKRALSDDRMRREAVAPNRTLVEQEGNQRTNVERMLGLLDQAVARFSPGRESSRAPGARDPRGHQGS